MVVVLTVAVAQWHLRGHATEMQSTGFVVYDGGACAGGTCTALVALAASVAVASALSRRRIAFARFAVLAGAWFVLVVIALAPR